MGVTGSGLTNLAFMRPGSIVVLSLTLTHNPSPHPNPNPNPNASPDPSPDPNQVELMSPLGTPNYFASLITRVHGALGRGVFTYKRVYFEPANQVSDQ